MPIVNVKKDALIEGVKEFGRVVIIAGVSAAITAALSWAAGIHDPTVQLVVITVLTGLGKGWDKQVHEDPTIAAKGIVPF